MTLKVIHRLQVFSNAILRRTFVQHLTRYQLTLCSHGSSALAELLVCCQVETVLGYKQRKIKRFSEFAPLVVTDSRVNSKDSRLRNFDTGLTSSLLCCITAGT